MADDATAQPDDLWHFERHRGFWSEGLSLSDGGVREDGTRVLGLWAEDGDHMVKVTLPWAAVRELADEILPDWLADGR